MHQMRFGAPRFKVRDHDPKNPGFADIRYLVSGLYGPAGTVGVYSIVYCAYIQKKTLLRS